MLSSMGVEVVDERPYGLEGLERPLDDLRVRPALRRADAQRVARAVPGRAARGVGRLQRDRRLQRAGARRRADLAAGHRAPRVREVHAAGQQPVRAGLHRGRAARERRHHPAAGRALRGAVRPGRVGDGGATTEEERLEQRILAALDDVASLDHDRILRSYLTHIKATLRTNYFQTRRRDRRRRTPTCRSSWSRRRSRTCRSRGPSSRSSSTHRGSRACTCASARSRAAACAGRTGATTSAPRCSAWSRRRW